MADSPASDQIQHQDDEPVFDQSVNEDLSRWAWDLQPPSSSRVSSPGEHNAYPGYISLSNEGLYNFSTEKLCRPAGPEAPAFTRASENRQPATDVGRDVSLDQDVVREREELISLAEKTITNPGELSKFKANVEALEHRASAQEPPLPASEIAKTYQQVARLLEGADSPNPPLTSANHVHLSQQVIEQAATPNSIDQGGHNTCTITTIESRAYTRHPSEAARLIADVATSGRYTTADGQVVEIPQSSLPPADSEARSYPTPDGERSHASQIFQLTAVNLYWSQHEYKYTDAGGNLKTVPAGKLRYQQVEPDPGNPEDSGERLIDGSVNPPAIVMDYSVTPPVPICEPQTDIYDDGAVKWMSDKITGTDDTLYVFHDGYENADGTGASLFNSQRELEQLIRTAEENGKLPIIMAVHTGKEPFWSDSGGGTAGGSGGWHVITITGYDASAQVVTVDNQWGSEVDHQGTEGIRLRDLYLASYP